MLRPKIFCKIGALFEKAGMLLKIAARATSTTAALERTTTATEARTRATITTKEQLLQQQKLRQLGHVERRDEAEVARSGISGFPVSVRSGVSAVAEFKILPGLDPGGEICQEGNLT